MPDQNVNVNLNVNDFLTAKIQAAKEAFKNVGDAAQQAGKNIGDWMNAAGQAVQGLIGKVQNLFTHLKSWAGFGSGTAAAVGGTAQAPGATGSGGQQKDEFKDFSEGIEKVKKSTEEESFLMKQIKELSAGIGYNIGLWNLGMIASQKILDAVVEGFTQAVSAQESFAQWQNVNRLSVDATRKSFDGLKEAAKEANIDFEKMALLDANKLSTIGVPLDDLNDTVKTLGEGFHDIGTDLTDVYAKAKLGTAGMGDFLTAANALGPAFQQAALDFNKLVVQGPQFERSLQAARLHLTRMYEDEEYQRGIQERLQDAQLSFANKIKATGPAGPGKGIGEQMMAYFAQAGTFQGAEYQIRPILPQGLGEGFGIREMDVIKKQLEIGTAQFAKDNELSQREVAILAKAGLVDTQTLMQAAQRAREEDHIQRQREEQLKMRELENQEIEHTVSLETQRKKLNDQIADSLLTQLKEIHAQSEEAKTVQANLDKAGHTAQEAARSIGDAMNAANKAATSGLQVQATSATGQAAISAAQARLDSLISAAASDEQITKAKNDLIAAQKGVPQALDDAKKAQDALKPKEPPAPQPTGKAVLQTFPPGYKPPPLPTETEFFKTFPPGYKPPPLPAETEFFKTYPPGWKTPAPNSYPGASTDKLNTNSDKTNELLAMIHAVLQQVVS